MKLSIVLSTHQTSFGALAFSGDVGANLATIASAGYQGVELAVRDASKVDAAEIRRLVSDSGLEVSAIGTGQMWNDDGLSLIDEEARIRAQTVDRLTAHLDLAASLDSLVIIGLVRGVVHGSPTEEVYGRLLDGLRAVAERAEQAGVRIAVEAINRYETSIVNTAAEGRQLLERLAAGNVGLLLDTFHMNIEEQSIEDSIRETGARIFHFHVADSNRCYPGNGHLDFTSILGALREIGYGGYVSGEFLPYPSAGEAARNAIAHLGRITSEG